MHIKKKHKLGSFILKKPWDVLDVTAFFGSILL